MSAMGSLIARKLRRCLIWYINKYLNWRGSRGVYMNKVDVTDMLYQLIVSEKMSRRDAVQAVADLLQMVLGEKTESPTPPKVMMDKPQVFTPKSIKYDPMYDPPPPFTSDPLPERVETPGRVLAKKNTACICNGCKKVVYVTSVDVVDGMKVSDFIEAYVPTEGMPKIDKTTEIQNLEGVISMDCPNCKSQKQLYLTGGPRT
jgi:hypothetical protein